jgi:hypothetical protein
MLVVTCVNVSFSTTSGSRFFEVQVTKISHTNSSTNATRNIPDSVATITSRGSVLFDMGVLLLK